MPLLYAPVAPGALSPRRPVPPSIARPEYVDRPTPAPYDGAARSRTPRRSSGCGSRAGSPRRPWPPRRSRHRPRGDHRRARRAWVTSSCSTTAPTRRRWATRGSRSRCARSVNEVVCHGIPDSRPLDDGDIVNIDVTAYIGGVHGDTDATYLVGDVDEESRLLVERTHEAMMRGIRAARPGSRDQRHRPGHRELRTPLRLRRRARLHRPRHRHARSTPGWSSPTTTPRPTTAPSSRPGMTFTIEPMLNLGTPEWEMWDDGWTVVTSDRRRSAQFEHTILVTDAGNGDPHPAVGSHASAPPRTPGSRHRPRQEVAAHQEGQAARHRHRGQFAQEAGRLAIDTPAVDRPRRPAPTSSPRSWTRSSTTSPQGDSPIGVTIPAVVIRGRCSRPPTSTRRGWTSTPRRSSRSTPARSVIVLNDADAAGIAELHYGAAKGEQDSSSSPRWAPASARRSSTTDVSCRTPSSVTSRSTATTPRTVAASSAKDAEELSWAE